MLAVGNAIVDVIAEVDDAFLVDHGLTKDSMQLIEPDRAEVLYAAMPPGIEASGGSAANTAVGVAALGGRAAFIGKVRADQLGEVYLARHPLGRRRLRRRTRRGGSADRALADRGHSRREADDEHLARHRGRGRRRRHRP